MKQIKLMSTVIFDAEGVPEFEDILTEAELNAYAKKYSQIKEKVEMEHFFAELENRRVGW